MLLQSYFPFLVLNRKTILSKKKKNQISCVYYLLTQRLLYLMTVKLPKWEIIFSRRWIPNGIALFQKTRAFNKFSWKQKEK